MVKKANKVYALRILVRPGPGCGMPPCAVGGEALCFVGAADRDTAVRVAFTELTGRKYVCEELIGRKALPIDPARWEEHAQDIRCDLAARFHGAGAALPEAAEIDKLIRDGGFRLGACFSWETEPQVGPEASAAAPGPGRGGPSPEAGEPGEGHHPPRRRKRRKRVSDDYTPCRPPRHAPRFLAPLVVGLFVCLGVALFWLTFVKLIAAYWLCAGGVATFLVGALWAAGGAKGNGIELWAPWEGTGVIALFQALMQLVSIPIISWIHLTSNLSAALPPSLVLLMGVGITASGVLLAR